MDEHQRKYLDQVRKQLENDQTAARIRKQIEDAREPMKQAQEQFRQMMEPMRETQERLRKLMEPMHETQERVRLLMEPFERIREQFSQTFKPIQDYIDANRAQMEQFTVRLNERYADLFADLKPLLPPPEVLEQWAKAGLHDKRLEEAGWLPHKTFLFILDDESLGAEQLSDTIEDFWRSNWNVIEAAFSTRIAAFAVDEEAKLTFREALSAHQQGHYRAVCRMLFPEFERIARYELHGGELKGLTSLRKFRNLAGNLGIDSANALGGLSIVRMFNVLFEHLYTRVETEEELNAIRDDAVPNRHACLHGIISYNSAKNSANMLIMADFIYEIVTLLKTIKADEEV